MKNKRFNGPVVLLVILSLFLPGCSKKEEKGGKEGVVTLRWVSDPNPLRKEQIARFERANPGIKVNIDLTMGGMALQKILTQVAGGNPPDLFDVPADTLPVFADL